MIQNEYEFTRNIPIDDFFSLLLKNRGSHTGWKFEYSESTHTVEWSPTILINIWRLNPKVTATLEAVSKKKTVCKITTANGGFLDPFKLFKRYHDKTVNKLFSSVKQQTQEYEQMSEDDRKKHFA